MVAEVLDGLHVGGGKGFFTDHVGEIDIQCCWVQPGGCELVVTGNVSTKMKNVIQNVKDMVVKHTSSIADVLGLTASKLQLMRRDRDLHVHVDHGYLPLKDTYYMGAVYVAMVSLMTGLRSRQDTVVFGDVGNATGRLSGGWDIDETYINNLYKLRYRRAVVADTVMIKPEAVSLAEAMVDGKPIVEIRKVGNILGALPLCLGPCGYA